jgi:hypothetical protein
LRFEDDHPALATVTGVFKNKVITVTNSWKLKHMALFSHINNVNNLETVETFSRYGLKYLCMNLFL